MLGIIVDAEATGLLKPGATFVEGTAGKTGVGPTVIGQAKGYHTVIVIPETQSPEKITLLCPLGVGVLRVPEKPYRDPGHYNRVAQRLAEEKGWCWANQFVNLANRRTHYRTTGPEIVEQTHGQVPAFVSAGGMTVLVVVFAFPPKNHSAAARRDSVAAPDMGAAPGAAEWGGRVARGGR